MQDYLLPNNFLTLEQQRTMFSLRCSMNKISPNFGDKQKQCGTSCGSIISNEHIYNCHILNNSEKPQYKYDKIYNGFLKEKVFVLEHMNRNMIRREQYENIHTSPCDPSL